MQGTAEPGTSSGEGVTLTAIREAGKQRNTEYLVAALADADPVKRGSAARYLGKSGDPAGVAPLVKLLHRDPKLRVLAIVSLERIGDTEALPALYEFATDPGSPLIVRVNAMGAMGALGDARAVSLLSAVVSSPPIDEPGLLPRDARALRRHAAGRLVSIGDISAAPVLEAASRQGNLRDRRVFARSARKLRARAA